MNAASLIIPSRAGAARLPILLEALRHQTYPEWEAIIVLDGDIDGSEQVVGRWSDLPVRSIRLDQNMGRATALNVGFAAADGDILIRCDDDFEPFPDHIGAHVEAHRHGLCGAIGLPLNIAVQNHYMRVYGRQADELGRLDAYAAQPMDRWRFWGGNTSVSRAVHEQIGAFDVSYHGYGWEDVDYGYRIHQAGLPIVMVPDAEVRHHMASINTRVRADRAFSSGRARRHFETLHGAGSSGSCAPPTSGWERLTRATARTLNQQRTSRLATAVDRALPVLPAPLGRKAVALVVESAARAGLDTPR